jgi:drug/metabolite transporter (DMT)-like permease
VAITKLKTQPASASTRGFIDRYSVFFVALAAVLWASDAYFRAQLIPPLGKLTASQIVVVEDALITLLLVVFLVRGWDEVRRLSSKGWLAMALIGIGPQAIATVLFTQSFSYHHYAETFVLQQTQPLIAILLAWVILGERRRPWFWPVAALAVIGVYMVVFAQDPTAPLADLQHGRLEAGLFALGAAALWASGTVLGRLVLGTLSFQTTTALRFTLALPVLVIILFLQNGSAAFANYQAAYILPFLGIALIPGLLALLLYYRALASTPASLATIAEMAFPVAATFIASAPPPYGFNQPLYPAQFVGTALLIVVVAILNWTKQQPAIAPVEVVSAQAV